MPELRLNWEISIGALLTGALTIATLLGIFYRLGRRFDFLERKVNIMFTAFLDGLAAKGVDVQALKRFFGEGK